MKMKMKMRIATKEAKGIAANDACAAGTTKIQCRLPEAI